MSNNNNSNNDPFAWAGLLKWSLSYMDGTTDVSNATPLSEEDKAFLEKVMKEGIVDEGARMNDILKQLITAMDFYRDQQQSTKEGTVSSAVDPPIEKDALEELLLELRDIVEQIDYARAFCSLQGLPFLLGCVSETEAVPVSIRKSCLGLIATLCQNNPPVQQQLLELGALKALSSAFFVIEPVESDSSSSEQQQQRQIDVRPQIMQAISAIVRCHELGEAVFCKLEQAAELFRRGLDSSTASAGNSLQSRTLFFLNALVTSDASTSSRALLFKDSIELVISDFLLKNEGEDAVDPSIRETSISFLRQLLERKLVENLVFLPNITDQLLIKGKHRMTVLQKLGSESNEKYHEQEIDDWKNVMTLLSQ